MWEYLNEVTATYPDPEGLDTLSGWLGLIINIVMGAAVSVSVIAIIYSGIQFIVSRGDFKALAKARTAFVYSIVAFILAIGAFTVKVLVFGLAGTLTSETANEVPDF